MGDLPLHLTETEEGWVEGVGTKGWGKTGEGEEDGGETADGT